MRELNIFQLLTLSFLIIGLSACEKENQDNNEPKDPHFNYAGEYSFYRRTNEWFDGGKPRVDTSITIGSVRVVSLTEYKYKFTIICGDGVAPMLFKWDEQFSFTFNFQPKNTHPHFEETDNSHYFFECKFLSYDSIYIEHQSGGLGGGATFRYYGSKIQ